MSHLLTIPRKVLMTVALLGAGACLGDTDLVTPPQAPATSFTLTFVADSEDAATAAALGWSDAIPDVAVTVTPSDWSGPPVTFEGSAEGTVTLDDLAARDYVVDVTRWLSDSERAALPAGDDAVGFVGRLRLQTATANANVAVTMAASRRHGLVISEFQGQIIGYRGDPEGYLFSGYVRLYNNGDSTVYLDGLLVGEGFAWQFDIPDFPCSVYRPFALDSLGVWARFFQQLPGSGQDYPLAPGETTVLVTDAIDHRPLYPIGLDLRQADFEFYDGGGDVDNPDVANAPSVGTQSPFYGHGLYWDAGGTTVVWLARGFDLGTVYTEVIPGPAAGRWARIPIGELLDVMAIKTTWRSPYPECPQFVLPKFDRRPVQLLGASLSDDSLAYKRLHLPFMINGLPVLQYTRASAWDFTLGSRTPFARP